MLQELATNEKSEKTAPHKANADPQDGAYRLAPFPILCVLSLSLCASS